MNQTHPTDGPSRESQAAATVLLELLRLLKDKRHKVTLIGGWAAAFMGLSQRAHDIPSRFTTDIDFAYSLKAGGLDELQQLFRMLTGHGFYEAETAKTQFCLAKKVPMDGGDPIEVNVEFLLASDEETPDIDKENFLHGISLAFLKTDDQDLAPVLRDLIDMKATDTVECQMTSIIPYLLMKAIAFDTRGSEDQRDAWDVYLGLDASRSRMNELAAEYLQLAQSYPSVIEARATFQKHFGDRYADGIQAIQNRFQSLDFKDAAAKGQEVFMLAQRFLKKTETS